MPEQREELTFTAYQECQQVSHRTRYMTRNLELIKVNKLKGPSENTLIPLGRENKAIVSGEGGKEGSGWERERGGEKGT